MSENNFNIDGRNKVKRVPDRGHYDRETLYQILDDAFVCHVGFVMDGQPFVIPMAYGRKDDKLYLHGATTSRLMSSLSAGIPVCITVTHVDGIVVARSAFHSSMNYRSAVVFGTATLVADQNKEEALIVVSEQILRDRWPEARPPLDKEMKATTVLEVSIEHGSSKIRTGPPKDDKEDYEQPYWAGVIPMTVEYGEAIPDPDLKFDLELPQSVKQVVG